MKLLIADDDLSTRTLLARLVEEWGYDAVVAADGDAAWEVLSGGDPPRIVILDWLMPGLDGIEICTRLGIREEAPLIFTILLTRKSEKEDIIHALDSGAHDFLAKPIDAGELRSRIAVGRRLVDAELEREALISQLREALSQIKTLHGLLPICARCKKVRDDKGYWTQIESYIKEHSEAEFSHGICPECITALYGRLDDAPEQGGTPTA